MWQPSGLPHLCVASLYNGCYNEKENENEWGKGYEFYTGVRAENQRIAIERKTDVS